MPTKRDENFYTTHRIDSAVRDEVLETRRDFYQSTLVRVLRIGREAIDRIHADREKPKS